VGILSRLTVGEGVKTYTAGLTSALPARQSEASNAATFTGGAPVVRSILPTLLSTTSEPALRGHAQALAAPPPPFQVFTANPAAARRAAQQDAVYSAASQSMVNRTAFGGVSAGIQTFTAGSSVARRANARLLSGEYRADQIANDMAKFDKVSADEVRAPEENKFGLKTIRDVNGNTLFEGEAVSKEALFAKVLKEEPNKSLAGIDLGGMSLDHRHDLSKRNLTGANIKGTQFDGCPMEGTVLAESKADKNTKFQNLHNANGLNLSNLQTEVGLDGKGLQMSNVKSAEMNWNGADLRGARIERLHTVKLEANDTNLSGASISQWVAEDTKSENMKMQNVRLGNSVLHGEFKGLDISGNKTKVNDTAFIGDMTNGKAVGASFTGKNFFAGEFGNFDFSRASFKGFTDMTHVTTREGPMHMNGTEIGGIKKLPKDPRTTVLATTIKNDGFEFKPNDGKTAITLDQVKVAGELAKREMEARKNNTITNLTGLNSGALLQAEKNGMVAKPDEDGPPTVAVNTVRPRRPAAPTVSF